MFYVYAGHMTPDNIDGHIPNYELKRFFNK